MSRLKVAAAQIECRTGDIAANVSLHLEALAEAKTAGANLVVFPELSLTDYELEPDLRALAIEAHSPQIDTIARACHGIAATVGFIEALDGMFYNSAATLAEGRVQTIHRKISLPNYGRLREAERYTTGTRLDLHAIDGWQTAMLICADTWDPALPWLVALKGCDVLLVPIASALDAVDMAFDNPTGWDVNLRHTAMTYGLPVVMCNHCGQRPGLRFWGGSRVLDANGKTLACADETPQMIYADLESDNVRNARERLPTVKAANPKLIDDLLRQVIGKSTP
jgi:predicted amidohydrolase